MRLRMSHRGHAPGLKSTPGRHLHPCLPRRVRSGHRRQCRAPVAPSQTASATVTAGAAAQKREIAKVDLYGEKCSRRAWGFTAFVGETTGAWGPAAQRTVRALVRAKSLRTGDDPEEIAHTFWGALGRAMASAVARQLVKARSLSGALRSQQRPVPASTSAAAQSSDAQAPSGAAGGPPGEEGPAASDLRLATELCL